MGCSSLKDIIFSKNLKKIDKCAFNKCGSIKITIPTSADINSMEENSDLEIHFYNPDEKSNEPQSNPRIIDDQCTFIQTGTKKVIQKLFICKTCTTKNERNICEACARNCHIGHNLLSLGFVQGYCNCGAGNLSCSCKCNKGPKRSILPFIPGPCTINKKGRCFVTQPFFRCITCNGDSNNRDCCEVCAKTCHLGHSLIYCGIITSYCRCGNDNPNCKCVKLPNPEYQEPQ